MIFLILVNQRQCAVDVAAVLEEWKKKKWGKKENKETDGTDKRGEQIFVLFILLVTIASKGFTTYLLSILFYSFILSPLLQAVKEQEAGKHEVKVKNQLLTWP